MFKLICLAGAVAATAGAPVELPTSNVHTQAGQFTALHAGSAYQASAFPLALRVAVPDGTWGGAQWKTTSHGKPAFGWVAVARAPLDDPRGGVEIETAFGTTPSVAATMARLRVGGSHLPQTNVGGVTWGKVSAVELAGYSGRQFDGNVWGIYGRMFVPFTPKTRGASPPDSFRLDKGETFRIVALDVRGKTVVLCLESFGLPADQFPAFLASAGRVLRTLRFPTS